MAGNSSGGVNSLNLLIARTRVGVKCFHSAAQEAPMSSSSSLVPHLAHWIHQRFIWLLIASYGVAALAPGLGLWIKNVTVAELTTLQTRLSLPMVLLAMLLFNAGLGVDLAELKRLLRQPA